MMPTSSERHGIAKHLALFGFLLSVFRMELIAVTHWHFRVCVAGKNGLSITFIRWTQQETCVRQIFGVKFREPLREIPMLIVIDSNRFTDSSQVLDTDNRSKSAAICYIVNAA
jgi:hypothetical protein